MAARTKLKAKQQQFVGEYLKDLNASQAAIRAGYRKTNADVVGPRLLGNVGIAAAIAKARAAQSERTQIDADYVLRQAVKLHERCMQEIRPFTDKKGNQAFDKNGNPLFVFNAVGAAKGLELVGKHIHVGAFEENVKQTGEVKIKVEYVKKKPHEG